MRLKMIMLCIYLDMCLSRKQVSLDKGFINGCATYYMPVAVSVASVGVYLWIRDLFSFFTHLCKNASKRPKTLASFAASLFLNYAKSARANGQLSLLHYSYNVSHKAS